MPKNNSRDRRELRRLEAAQRQTQRNQRTSAQQLGLLIGGRRAQFGKATAETTRLLFPSA